MKTISAKTIGLVFATTLCAGSLHGAATDELSRRDREFVKNAAEMSLTEIELGKLAEEKGASANVRVLGSKLIADHTKSIRELRALAKAKKYEVDWQPTGEQRALLAAFGKKSGAEFDTEFLDHVAKDHETAIKSFVDTAKNTDDPDVRMYVEKSLVALRSHRLSAAGHGKPEAVGEKR